MQGMLGRLIHRFFDFLHARSCGCTFTNATEEKLAELEANRLNCPDCMADPGAHPSLGGAPCPCGCDARHG